MLICKMGKIMNSVAQDSFKEGMGRISERLSVASTLVVRHQIPGLLVELAKLHQYRLDSLPLHLPFSHFSRDAG